VKYNREQFDDIQWVILGERMTDNAMAKRIIEKNQKLNNLWTVQYFIFLIC